MKRRNFIASVASVAAIATIPTITALSVTQDSKKEFRYFFVGNKDLNFLVLGRDVERDLFLKELEYELEENVQIHHVKNFLWNHEMYRSKDYFINENAKELKNFVCLNENRTLSTRKNISFASEVPNLNISSNMSEEPINSFYYIITKSKTYMAF